jgi:hypothetical protein
MKIKGYKAMNEDMTCRGFQYEVGKTYTIEGGIKICGNGFHFCRDIISVFNYYGRFKSRVFEVEADGYIEKGDKLCCQKITIVREVKGIELNRILYGDGYGSGYGSDDGNGYGSGYGYGYGYSYGYSYGDGSGYGYSYGDGSGYGYSYGDGYGDGDGNGNGCDYGYGKNIQKILDFMEE